jgi:hypothetical protein
MPSTLSPLANRFAGREKLPACSLGEPICAYDAQHLMGSAQLFTSVNTTAVPAQPFAIDQVGSRKLDAHACTAQPVNRFLVQGFCNVIVAQ